MFHKLNLRSVSLALLIISVLVFGALNMQPPQKVYAINTPWLHVSGNKLMDPSNNVVILRGVDLTDLAVVATHGKTASQLIDMATDSANGWYAHVVRLAVYPDAIDHTAGWNAGPDAYFNTYLNPAVNECVARQIYCIIDWHYITDYSSAAVNTATTNFWNYVAPKYANTPNVIFELYNEPTTPNSWSTWKSTAQPWVNIIRAAAPNNIILIGSPQWSQITNNAASSPFSGSNLMYVVHIYPQHGGQSTWDSWMGNTSGTVPYFVTEYGWQNGGSNPTSGTTSGYGVPFENYLDSKGISSTAWVFDTVWQPIMFDTSWNLLGGDGYMGQQTKTYLANHKNDNLPGPGGPTNTPTPNTPPPGNTPTRTSTTPPGLTPTRTSTTPPGATPTRTPTTPPGQATATRTPTTPPSQPTNTPTQPTGCTTITAPFTKDGAGTLCWQIANIPGYINSWNLTSLTVNGVNETNLYVATGSLPAKVNGLWTINYSASVAWAHFEAK
jgi:endoglucanase